MFVLYYVALASGFLSRPVASFTASPAELASRYSLTTSTVLPFPVSTLGVSNTEDFLVSQWSLSKGRVQSQPEDLQFTSDPFSSSAYLSESPVLQVTYPQGSYSHDTGGAQFENLWNSSVGSPFRSMMLSYELAFEAGFDWVKGGKLPGIRGGSNTTGCSGGSQPTGEDCFSVRVMWRSEGSAEIYAYIPTPNGLCDARSIVCNSDYGVSVSRGAFFFDSGRWNTVTMLVQLNEPVDVANGNVQLYYNGLLVISQSNLQLRTTENLNANGLYFSTFFGGADDSWATPQTTHTYFRNISLWGGLAPSNLDVSAAKSLRMSLPTKFLLFPTIVSLLCFVGVRSLLSR